MSAKAPAWRNRIVGYGSEAPDQLLANPANWRIHTRVQQQATLGLLNEVGVVQNVIVNKRTGFMVDGHMRVAMAISEHVSEVPITYVDLDETEERKVLASFDPLGAMARQDDELLGDLLDGLEVEDEALRSMLDGLIEQDKETPEKVRGEVTLSPELLERQDYLVVVFDNELDWRAICDELEIHTVFEQDPDTVRKGAQSANTGIGRVLMGKALLARLRGDEADVYGG